MFAYSASSPSPPFCALDALLHFKDSLLCVCPLEALLLSGTHMRLVRQAGSSNSPGHSTWEFFFPVTFLGLPELKERKVMVDHLKPLPSSLPNEFIPEEVLLSLNYAANAGPCPENLLPSKKLKAPKVRIHMPRIFGVIIFFLKKIHFIKCLVSINYIFQMLF